MELPQSPRQMTSSAEQTAPSESAATPDDKKILKPIKAKLRLEDFRQCRLCLRFLPRMETLDTLAPRSDFRRKIADAVSVKICPSDKVTSVCINCIRMVDITIDFRGACRNADTLHRTKLMILHPGSWLSEENKSKVTSCHRLIRRNRVKLDELVKCSSVKSEEIEQLIQGEETVLELKTEPVMDFERVDVPIAFKSLEEEVEIKIEEESDQEMSEQVDQETSEEHEISDQEEMSDQIQDQETSEKWDPEHDVENYEARRAAAKFEAKMNMCELCGTFVQKAYTEQHMNRHLGLNPYKCPEENCNKSFASNLVMNIHVINVHRRGKRKECEICHKLIKDGPFFKQHLETHQANNTLKVPCSVCGKMFYKRYIRDHMFIHTGETPYKCEFCDRKFAARNNLAVHRRKQHADKLQNQG